jgi:alcohol dehydrogenase (cytochrome c)
VPFLPAALLIFGLTAQQHPAETVATRGRELFVRSCSACHGDTGKGGRGPDLTTGAWKHGGSDDEIARNIVRGIAGTQMPAIAMADADARAIVAYLRAIGPQSQTKGDAAAGRVAFDAQCRKCHALVPAGSKAPETLTYLSARGVRGVVKDEDTFHARVYDPQARKWHTLDKAGPVRREDVAHPAAGGDVAEFLNASALPANRMFAGEWRPADAVTASQLNATPMDNWLSYWGDLRGTHRSGLTQITTTNVANLRSAWTFQTGGNTIETTPLVANGMMFVTGPLNNAAALDARTGRPYWRYTRKLPEVASHCTVMTNRGFAMLGDRLYMGTLDTHLVALDSLTGRVVFDVEVDDYRKGFSITHAPLAIDGKIIVGVTSGECALTGFVDAYDAKTGKRLWRTYSTPQPGDPNRKTWNPEKSADVGGAPTWMTGTYDAETDTVFWTTGNPGPDYDGSVREGDNLYACSVLALDARTGRMKWWFQFTPHDVHDWDGNQTPMLIDATVKGVRRKLLVTAQRNAFYYVLDRVTGEFVAGRAFAKQTWAKGLDAKGRPIVLPNTTPTPEGNYVCPDAAGATNWGSPSFDPVNGLFVVSVRESCATYTSVTKEAVPGQGYTGGGQEIDPKIGTPGAVRALDVVTGETRWNFPLQIGTPATGVLTTAGGVTFASSNDGYLIALDSRNGKVLWKYNTGASIIAAPMSFAVDGKQYIGLASQSAIFTFALP